MIFFFLVCLPSEEKGLYCVFPHLNLLWYSQEYFHSNRATMTLPQTQNRVVEIEFN